MNARHLAGGLLIAALAAPSTLTAQTAPGLAASPLAAYPGFGHNPTADEARYKREQAARERSISACMRQQGLSYTVSPPQDENPGGGRRRGAAAPTDPNDSHAATLSPEERARYYTALYGVADPNDQSGQLWRPGSATGGGCWGDALRTFPGVYAARSRLAEQFSELRQAVATDPEVTAAEGRWSICMRGKGFTFASPRAMSADTVRPGADEARLASAHAADPACRAESGLKAAVERAKLAREAAFVTAHRDQLEGHKRALEAQPAAE
jgi:hypothetical protein